MFSSETGERPGTTVTPSEAASSASQRPECFRLPKSGGDPYFGFTRSFYYEGESRGYWKLVRIRERGKLRGVISSPTTPCRLLCAPKWRARNEVGAKRKAPAWRQGAQLSESGEASQSRGDTSSSIVDELLDLLGTPAVLLPIPRGSKRPVTKRWQFTKADQMRDPKYLAKLNRDGNIGVLLGNGLITIDFDQDLAVEPFLNLNPKLRSTLRTRRVRGCNFWLRIKGHYPPACKLTTRAGEDFGEWRADGNQTIIHGAAIDGKKGEKQPTAYKIENRGPILELAFDEIHWPDDVVLPWKNTPSADTNAADFDDAELRLRYGLPYYCNSKAEPSVLNEAYWAGLYAIERRGFIGLNPQTPSNVG